MREKTLKLKKQSIELFKKVGKMELGNPILTTLVGLVVFYIGLKMFSGGMKSMGNIEHLSYFTHNVAWMFLGGIIMTLLWQSSSLSTTAIIALVASGAVPLPAAIAAVLGANIGTTGTIWLAGLLVSDGMPKGDTLRIAMMHTGANLFMAISLLPFVHHIGRFLGRF
jgi:Na+/phosphate symporter